MAVKKKAAVKEKAAVKGKKPSKTVSAKPAKSAAAKASRPAAPAPAKKKAAARPAQPAKVADPNAEAEALAKKIVRFTTANSVEDHIDELYTDDCFSVEASGDAVQGREGIVAKNEQWNQMTEGSTLKPRNVIVRRNLIAIEWEGEVKMRDGRTVALSEVAVHEVRGGKIAAERYYYNPAVFSGQSSGRVELPPEPLPPVQPPRGTPPVDPFDL